jgi:hypothetical protein
VHHVDSYQLPRFVTQSPQNSNALPPCNHRRTDNTELSNLAVTALIALQKMMTFILKIVESAVVMPHNSSILDAISRGGMDFVWVAEAAANHHCVEQCDRSQGLTGVPANSGCALAGVNYWACNVAQVCDSLLLTAERRCAEACAKLRQAAGALKARCLHCAVMSHRDSHSQDKAIDAAQQHQSTGMLASGPCKALAEAMGQATSASICDSDGMLPMNMAQPHKQV